MVWLRMHLATADSILCWKIPRLARWQVTQVNTETGTALDVDSMRFRWARSAAIGVVWANARLPESARLSVTYRLQPINRSR